MPKLVNKIPSYSLHKASGQARVKVNGKTTYLGKYGTPESKEAYARFIAGLPKPGEQPALAEPIPGMTLTVGECALRYFEYARTYYTRDGVETSEVHVIRTLVRPLNQRYADLPATELGPKKLKLVQAGMVEAGASRYSINKMTSIVKRCFTWCASEELIPAAIAMGLKTVKGLSKGRTAAKEFEPVEPVPFEHVEAVVPFVSELVADVLRVMMATGARPGEVVTMTAAEIDRTDPTCWKYVPDHHKTSHRGKSRVVFRGETGAQQIILPRLLKAGDGPIFPIERRHLYFAVRYACRKARIPHWHPNQIRHTVGTEVRSKYGLEAAQVLLGHSRADVTQTYAERDMVKAQEVARKIG